MKIQDILFFLVFAFAVWKRNPKLAVIIGLTLLIASIPLFSFWIFFTAERLTWYAAGFFLLAIMFNLFNNRREHEKE